MTQEFHSMAAVDSAKHSIDDESRLVEIVAILAVGSVLSTAAVGLRAFTRLNMLHTFGADDSVMLVAQMFTLGSAVAIGLGESRHGLGSHSWVPPPEDYIPYMKSFYSSIIVYNIATCLVKISILLQYRRIFANKVMQRLTTYGLAFLLAWLITLSVLLPLMCYPVAAFWDSSVSGRCLDYLAIWYAMAGINLVADFVIFSMPIPVINSLQLPRRQKRMLLFVFGLGFFTCIISALRIRTLRVAADTKDPYWDNVDAATWSFLEITIGILAACLPTLRPLFVTLLPRFFAGSSLNLKSGGGPSRSASPYVQPSQLDSRPDPLFWSQQLPTSISTEGLKYYDDVELGGHEAESSAEYTVKVSADPSESPDVKMLRRESKRANERTVTGEIHVITTTVVTQEISSGGVLSKDNSHKV
ncbi:integral membrane protein [Colletotrichum plurivorum]|uniref:Integral membrane protein n=1 Tax=Colletotrichum plurivorum TaxID=2175906 RepID=A0A8H6JDN8_9PEZI|nr:integral membrane protein [Colletotrichum plurivorum]